MGKPTVRNGAVLVPESIGCKGHTRGTETSQYPEEEKETFDSPSSGERNGKSPNQEACLLGL